MIVIENEALEKSVLSGVSCIAVPVEAFVPSAGEPVITTYSACADVAKEWENKFSHDILCGESVDWIENRMTAFAEKLGYRHFESENEYMTEYVYLPYMQMANRGSGAKVHKISSNAVLSELCENSGCDIEIADDGEDVIFAVVEGGCILAYAGMNDVIYDDNSVEISVETAPDCRRLGYGSACVSALTEHLLSKGVTVRYKCSRDNKASCALAEKLGYRLEGRRYSFVCERVYAND